MHTHQTTRLPLQCIFNCFRNISELWLFKKDYCPMRHLKKWLIYIWPILDTLGIKYLWQRAQADLPHWTRLWGRRHFLTKSKKKMSHQVYSDTFEVGQFRSHHILRIFTVYKVCFKIWLSKGRCSSLFFALIWTCFMFKDRVGKGSLRLQLRKWKHQTFSWSLLPSLSDNASSSLFLCIFSTFYVHLLSISLIPDVDDNLPFDYNRLI